MLFHNTKMFAAFAQNYYNSIMEVPESRDLFYEDAKAAIDELIVWSRGAIQIDREACLKSLTVVFDRAQQDGEDLKRLR